MIKFKTSKYDNKTFSGWQVIAHWSTRGHSKFLLTKHIGTNDYVLVLRDNEMTKVAQTGEISEFSRKRDRKLRAVVLNNKVYIINAGDKKIC